MAPRFEPQLIPAGNPGPYTGRGNNTYLIAAGNVAALVDAGTGNAAHLEALGSALAAQRSTLDRVLVTHAHLDHASGAPVLAARFAVRLFVKRLWPGHDVAGVDWQHIDEGAEVRAAGVTLTALHTPGHSPDHLSFWHEPSRTLFSGDLVQAGSTVAIIHSRGGDLSEYLATLERLRRLRPARLLPAHGPVIDDPERVLRATLDHRRARDAQVAAAVAAGRDTVQAIADSIYDDLSPALMPLARENVRAHLEKLRREGRVRRLDGAAAASDECWRPAAE